MTKKKENVGFDTRVGIEHAVGQADDGVQVAFGQQFFFEAGFHTFAK